MYIIKMLVILILSYMIGSISSSIIISKVMTGEDIRKHGSGNAGATNALRVLGKKGGILTLLGDVVKTVAAIFIAKLILNNDISVYVAGIGAVLGHNYPLWFGFKGGKGIAVSITAILFADIRIGLIVLVFSLLIMIFTKYVSLGSVLGAVLCIVLSLIFRWDNKYYILFTVIVGVLAVYRHKANIVRLLKGEENKLGSKNK